MTDDPGCCGIEQVNNAKLLEVIFKNNLSFDESINQFIQQQRTKRPLTSRNKIQVNIHRVSTSVHTYLQCIHTHTYIHIYRVGQKKWTILKCISPVYDDVGSRSIYQNVQLFIRSKSDILNVAIFKHSLHRFRETTLHRKYQLI